jgi:hypothetical protein
MMINRGISFEGNSAARSQVAPRTPCMPCKARGHHCDAFEIVAGRAVCIHCLDGVDCPRTPRNGVVDAPRRPAAVLTSTARVLSVREVKAIRRLAKVGRSLENIANQYDLSLTRLGEVLNESPEDEAMPSSPPTTVQAALAPGAEPSAAMPARRVFPQRKVLAREKAKAMLVSGMSVTATRAATGLGRNTVLKVRHEVPGLRPKGGPPLKAADMSAAAAEQVVAEAEAITAQVADEVERRSVQPDGESANLKQGDTKLATTNDVAAKAVSALSAKSIAEGYKVVSLADIPGRKPASVYEDVVADLAALPVNAVVTRSFTNENIAHTFMCGITRIARSRGVKVSQAQDGATIYVWRKA